MNDERTPRVFFSYAHFDDEFENGALSDFRNELSRMLRFLSGNEVAIFQDIDDISPGEHIHQRISTSMNEAMVLIPIITPSYFHSSWCRAELQKFLDRERELGRNDLIVSVYYQQVPELDAAMKHRASAGAPPDPFAHKLARRLAVNWQPLRGKEFSDSEVRKELERIAKRVLVVLRQLEWSHPAEQQSFPTTHEEIQAELAAARDQLAEAQQKLQVIQLQKVGYASSGNVPMSLLTAEQSVETRIKHVQARIDALTHANNHFIDEQLLRIKASFEAMNHASQQTSSAVPVEPSTPHEYEEDEHEPDLVTQPEPVQHQVAPIISPSAISFRTFLISFVAGILATQALALPLYYGVPTAYTSQWRTIPFFLEVVGYALICLITVMTGYVTARLGWMTTARQGIKIGSLSGGLVGVIAWLGIGAATAGVIGQEPIWLHGSREATDDELIRLLVQRG